jgi:hypothetical protein
MQVNFEVHVFDKEPRYLVRNLALPKEKQIVAGNPKALGRAITKLIDRQREQEQDKAA